MTTLKNEIMELLCNIEKAEPGAIAKYGFTIVGDSCIWTPTSSPESRNSTIDRIIAKYETKYPNIKKSLEAYYELEK